MNNDILKPKDLNPKLLKFIEDKFGEIDYENDFFSSNLDKYYKTSNINSKTGGVSHKIYPLSNFGDSFKKMSQALQSLNKLAADENDPTIKSTASQLKTIFNTYRTYLRKNYPEQYKKIKNKLTELYLHELEGMSYNTKYAFKKELKEEENVKDPYQVFHNQRIEAFDLIENEINNIYKILSNAKNKTIKYYNDNPTSYSIITPTDLILDYIKDIKTLLEQ